MSGATRQKNIFRIHNCTCITTGYRMRPINNSSTLFVLASHASRVGRLFLLQPYVNVFVVRNQHLESSILLYISSRSSRVAWARTSIHVQEYGTRHQHVIHMTPYFLESMLEQSLQPRRFSNSAITRRVRWGFADSWFPQLRSHL